MSDFDTSNYDENEVMTLTEIARHLRVSERTVLRMLENEQLPGGKIGGQWRFHRDAVDAWLLARIGGAAPEQLVQVVATKKKGLQRIPDLLPPERILLDLAPGGITEILRQLVAPLSEAGIVPDADKYLEALVSREELFSTAISEGIALPHARDPRTVGARENCLVLGISREGIDFDALEGGLTHVFVLICAVSIASHLRLMAKVSLMLRIPNFVEDLRTARTKEDVRALLFRAHQDFSIRL